jgi:hypothetical protein
MPPPSEVRSTEPIKFSVIRLAAPAGAANINKATKLRTRILVVGGTMRAMDLSSVRVSGEGGQPQQAQCRVVRGIFEQIDSGVAEALGKIASNADFCLPTKDVDSRAVPSEEDR